MQSLDSEAILTALPPGSEYVVAFSGGCDSLVLLHLMQTLRARLSAQLRAVHVHHGLHPRADAWAGHCERVCAALGVPLTVVRVDVASGPNLEARARHARYRALTDVLARDGVVLTAHHADDQAETVLLRAMRGSGVTGLAAIPRQRPLPPGKLVRPLLDWSRQQLRAYAEDHGLVWIDDPSNADRTPDRNFLRHAVMPQLRQRWPRAAAGLGRLAGDAAESDALLEELARLDGLADTPRLALSCLQGVSEPRARNLLRHWIRAQGLPLPGRKRLQSGLIMLLTATDDRQPAMVWPGGRIRRYHGTLYLDDGSTLQVAPDRVPLVALAEQRFPWGRLRVVSGGALRADLSGGPGLMLRFDMLEQRVQPVGRPRKRLGRLLQEARVPPWQRTGWPLLCRHDQVLAVPGVCVCVGAETNDETAGYALEWHPADGPPALS